jgi:Ca-activated chloride channel homolog
METSRRPSRRAIVGVLAVILMALAFGGCAQQQPGSSQQMSGKTAGSEPSAPVLDAPPESPPKQPQPEQRDIVTTGTIVVTVSDVGAAADKLAGLAKDSGGRMDSRTESATSTSGTSTSGDVEPSAQLTLRIPSAKLDDFLAGAKGVGTVTSLSLSHDDVTAQRVDQDARIQALQTSVTRLTELMRTASSTADLLQAEEQLSKRQAELDSLRSQRATLGDQISYATITVSLSTEPAAVPLPTGFTGAMHQGWTALLAVLRGATLAFGFVLPWIPVMVILAAAAFLLLRRQRRYQKGGGS